jgi:hypothetical protein
LSYKNYFKNILKHGLLVLATPAYSTLSWHLNAILYCKEHSITTVADGQIDTLSSDITLVGKNYSGFGEALNENLVKLLENFANSSRPERPTRGQIWFDTTESKLKVYTGISFVPVSSATVSGTQPTTLGVGDLWYKDVDQQLYFFDGTRPILLAPAFSVSQGKSGLEVSTILDSISR